MTEKFITTINNNEYPDFKKENTITLKLINVIS